MIAIVTDSSAHLYRAEAERLGVTIVPMYSADVILTARATRFQRKLYG